MSIFIWKYIAGVNVEQSREIHNTFPYMITKWNEMSYDLYFDDLLKHWDIYLKMSDEPRYIRNVREADNKDLTVGHMFIIEFVNPLLSDFKLWYGDDHDYILKSKKTGEVVHLEEWSIGNNIET
jgi:hypothetical protein